jgi:hypothetical protein
LKYSPKINFGHMPPINKEYKEGGIVPVSLAQRAKGDRCMGYIGWTKNQF